MVLYFSANCNKYDFEMQMYKEELVFDLIIWIQKPR